MCKRAFESLGCDVTLINQELNAPPFLGRFGVGVDNLRKRIVSKCESVNPDIVLVIKGYNLDDDTIQCLNERTSAVLVNWNPDNPFQVRSTPKLAEAYLQSLPAYDVVFIWGEFLIDRLYEYGARRVEHLPFGYDPEFHRPMEPNSEYACDVIFLGHWSKKRERVLENITNMDVDFDLWGNYWKWRCWKPSLRRCLRGDALMGESYARAMSSAKIVVNVVADHNMPAYNMRTFEIPATRSFMLTTDTEGQRKIFDPEQEAAMYEGPQELAELISYYLDADQERQAIADRGHKRVQNHSYRDRMEKVLNVSRDIGL